VGITLLRQGLLYPSRWKFWKLFFKALMRFPKRFPYFVTSCIMAEHYYEFREIIKTKLRAKLAHNECELNLSRTAGTTTDDIARLEQAAGAGR
jgi:hypothetical protein